MLRTTPAVGNNSGDMSCDMLIPSPPIGGVEALLFWIFWGKHLEFPDVKKTAVGVGGLSDGCRS